MYPHTINSSRVSYTNFNCSCNKSSHKKGNTGIIKKQDTCYYYKVNDGFENRIIINHGKNWQYATFFIADMSKKDSYTYKNTHSDVILCCFHFSDHKMIHVLRIIRRSCFIDIDSCLHHYKLKLFYRKYYFGNIIPFR